MENNSTAGKYCGTQYGAKLHYLNKDPLCLPCREVIRARNKAWKKANPDKVRDENTAWRASNRVHLNELAKVRYYKDIEKHRNKARRITRKRRALKLDNGHIPYLEQDILDTYGNDCHLCLFPIDLDAPRGAGRGDGWENGLHLDHLIPLTKGGSDTLENIRPAHGRCNMTKGNSHKE